jgi:uncharacterized protein DUF1707
VTAGRGDETAAAAARRGSLRASRADREQVVDVLKAAFVEGRLTQDELEARAGQAFASRTYGELAALTADLPAGLIASPLPRKATRARTWPPLGQIVAGAGLVIPLPLLLLTVFLTDSERVARFCLMIIPWYFVAWIVAGVQLIDSWQKRTHRQSPSQPPRGQALKRERRSGIGNDLILFEARGDVRADRGDVRADHKDVRADHKDVRAVRTDVRAGRKDARLDAVPGPGLVLRAWRSLTVHRPANLQVTA